MFPDSKEYCRRYYQTALIPLTGYNPYGEILFSFPALFSNPDLTQQILPALLRTSKNPDYFITKSFFYYGMIKIRSTSELILAGPVSYMTLTPSAIKDFLRELGISTKYEQDITSVFHMTPILSPHRFLSVLTYLHYCLNGESLDLENHFHISSDTFRDEISCQHSNQIYRMKEEQQFHNTYQLEQQYLSCITNGEPEKLHTLLKETAPSLKEGTIAGNALRQSKNIFIAATTLSTRSAINGGLDIEQAYQLSDIYIRECEKLQSPGALVNLQFTMIMDFAERVARSKFPADMSQDIFECIQYISRQTNKVLRIEDVAAHIGKSRSYASKKFKTELGFTMHSFIMRCKLEEAKSLLTYSAMSLSEISSYLCFSSQAYFQNVFKKKYGATPMQYRNRTRK